VFGLKNVLLIGLLLLIVFSSGCISGSLDDQTNELPQTTIPPETPAEHFPEAPPFPVCQDGETRDATCPDGVTTYLNENCVDGEWHQVTYIRNPCEPLTTTSSVTTSTEAAVPSTDEPAVVCDEPYIRHGFDCCLDVDYNNICDVDEEAISTTLGEELTTTTTVTTTTTATTTTTQRNLLLGKFPPLKIIVPYCAEGFTKIEAYEADQPCGEDKIDAYGCKLDEVLVSSCLEGGLTFAMSLGIQCYYTDRCPLDEEDITCPAGFEYDADNKYSSGGSCYYICSPQLAPSDANENWPCLKEGYKQGYPSDNTHSNVNVCCEK
jgi:hypothetical protein